MSVGLVGEEVLVGMKEDRFIAVSFDFANSFFKLEFSAQQVELKMADVEQMKKIIPFVTCEITFVQHVCKWVFGVDILESWDPHQFCQKTSQEQLGGFLIDVSLWGFFPLYHLDHGFVVLKKCAASDRFEKTSRLEMIMRINVSIVSSSAAKCIDSFPCPLLLRIPLDNGVAARKIGCPLSANSNSISSAI